MEGVEFGSASKVGRGGMEAKVASAWDAAQAGVVTIIANGKKSDVLLKARPWARVLLPVPACFLHLHAWFCSRRASWYRHWQPVDYAAEGVSERSVSLLCGSRSAVLLALPAAQAASTSPGLPRHFRDCPHQC